MSDGGKVQWDEPEWLGEGGYIPGPPRRTPEERAAILAEVAARYGDGFVKFAEGGVVE
jgi:hypothetical protein